MSENPFEGATRDPIGMLEQLIKMTGDIRADVAELKQTVAAILVRLDSLEARMDRLESRMDRLEARMDRLEARMDGLEHRIEGLELKVVQLGQEVAQTSTELKEMRGEIVRLHKSRDQAYEGLKQTVSAEIEQKSWYEAQRILLQVEDRYSALERRIAHLEAAERRRREGAGA